MSSAINKRKHRVDNSGAKVRTPSSHFLTYQGSRIHYIKTGQARPVILFIHGLPLHSQSWQCQINYFKKNYTIIALDLPGYGLSSPLPSGLTEISKFYSDTISHVLKVCGIKKVIYVGFASGGHVGLRFAIDHHKQLDRLILIHASPKFTISKDWPYGFSEAKIRSFIKRIKTMTLSDEIKSLIYYPTKEKCDKKIDLLRSAFVKMGLQTKKRTLISFFKNQAYEDFRDYLPHIHVPTLMITGTLNKEVPPGVGLYLRQHIPHSQLIELNEKDHFLFATAVALVNRSIENFIQPQCDLCLY